MGVINQVLKPNLIHTYKRIRVYKTFERLVQAHDSQAWAICKRDEGRITATGMKPMRRTRSYTCLDCKNNLEIMKVSTRSIMEFIEA